MKPTHILGELAPWLTFAAVACLGDVTVAAYASAASAFGCLALLARAVSRDAVLMLQAIGLVVYGALSATLFLAPRELGQPLAELSGGAALIVLASLLALSTVSIPFVERISRPYTDPRYWGSPVLQVRYRRMSLNWVMVMLGIGLACVTGGLVRAT